MENTTISWVQCTNKSCTSGAQYEEEIGWIVVDEETMKKAKCNNNWLCRDCSEQITKKKQSLLNRYQIFKNQIQNYKEANSSQNSSNVLEQMTEPDSRIVYTEFSPEYFDQSSAAWMKNKVRMLDDNGFTVGYRYKNPRQKRLWQPTLRRRKKRRRFK